MSFGRDFRFTLLTTDAELAHAADAAGVDRIGVDLERLGKRERQKGFDGRLSDHDWTDIGVIAAAARRAKVFFRINPPHDAMQAEVERALALGAGVIMLPYFTSASEVARFVDAVAGRAVAIALIETAPALQCARDILAVRGLGEAMAGLNDLRIALGVASHFEVLASPALDRLADEARRAGVPFSIGGLGRWNDPTLPVDPDLVYAQYPRLGATGAWLSRSFVAASAPPRLAADVAEARARLDHWAAQPAAALIAARDAMRAQAAEATRRGVFR